jgi:predicted enzyme involved in methoxymalonyl-ACP biosynthesis
MVASLQKSSELRYLVDGPSTPTTATFTANTAERKTTQGQMIYEGVHKPIKRKNSLTSSYLNIEFAHINSTKHPSFLRTLVLLGQKNALQTTLTPKALEECVHKFAEGWDFISFMVRDGATNYGIAACAWVSGHVIEQIKIDKRVILLGAEKKIISWLAHLMHENGAQEIMGRCTPEELDAPFFNPFESCGFQKKGDLWHKPLGVNF